MSKIIDFIKKLKPKHFGDSTEDPIGVKPIKPVKPISSEIPVPKDPTIKDR